MQRGVGLVVHLNAKVEGGQSFVQSVPGLGAALMATRSASRGLAGAGVVGGLQGLTNIVSAAQTAYSKVKHGHSLKSEEADERQRALAAFYAKLCDHGLVITALPGPLSARQEARFKLWPTKLDTASLLYLFDKRAIATGAYLAAEGKEPADHGAPYCNDSCAYHRKKDAKLEMVYCEACEQWFHVDCLTSADALFDRNPHNLSAFVCEVQLPLRRSPCTHTHAHSPFDTPPCAPQSCHHKSSEAAPVPTYTARSSVACGQDCGFREHDGRNEAAGSSGSYEHDEATGQRDLGGAFKRGCVPGSLRPSAYRHLAPSLCSYLAFFRHASMAVAGATAS